MQQEPTPCPTIPRPMPHPPPRSRWEDLQKSIASVLRHFVWKLHDKLQHHVPPLIGIFGQGQSLAHDPLLHARFDDIARRHGDGPAIQRRCADRAATQRLWIRIKKNILLLLAIYNAFSF